MADSYTEATRNTFRGWLPLQQIRMCQIPMPNFNLDKTNSSLRTDM